MTARTVYEAASKSAGAAKLVALIAAESVKQTTIDNANSVQGYTTQAGNYGALAAAIKSAVTARNATLDAAERARQSAIDVARDTLRDSGDRSAT